MALKYYSEFYGEQTDSLYRVELWDSTFGGAATLLDMGFPGYELTYDSQADDLFTPIKSSSVKVYWMVENSTVQTYFEGLINKQEGEIVINIIFAGSTIWQGTVITEQVQFEHASYPLLCTMNAVDGIGRLKGIEWSSANWSSVIYPGGVPLPIIPLNKLLADIFLHCTDYVDTSLGTLLTTNVIVEHDGMDLQSYNQISEAMGFEFEAFKLLDGESQDGRVYWYYYDVLLEVCRSLGARVYFSDGRWVFKQVIQEQYYTTTIYNNFDFSGDFVNGGSIDWSADYDTLGFKWLAEPVDTFSQPIKKIILPAFSRKNLLTETIPLPTYEYTSSNFEANYQHVLYWDLDSLVQVPINGMLNKKLQFKLDFNITDQDKLERVRIFYIRLYIRTTAGTWYALSNYNSTTQSHWNNNPVGPNPLVWTSGVNPATADNNHVQQYYGGQQSGTIEFISPPCPIDDIDEVVFMIGVSGLGMTENTGYFTNGQSFITSCPRASFISNGARITAGIYFNPATAYVLSTNGNYLSCTGGPWGAASGYSTFYADELDKSIQSGDTTLVEFESLILAQVESGEYLNDKGTAYIVSNPLDATIVQEDALYKVLDNIGGNLKTAIRFYDGVGWDYTQQDWKILPALATETGTALIQKLGEYKMRYNRKSMYVIEGTLRAGLYRPELVLLYRSLVWVFIGGTFSANDELWKVTFMAIDLAGEGDIDFDPDIDSNYAPNVDSNKKPYIEVKIDKLDRNDSNIYTAANGALSILQTTKAQLEALIFATPIVQYIPSGTTLPTTEVLNGEWQLQAEDGQTNVYINNAWQRGVKLITDTTGDLRYVKRDGTTPLTANWNAGAYSITANSVIIGSAANTISGGAASGGNITIQSTTHATKGLINFGSASNYDETNQRLTIGTQTPVYTTDINIAKTTTSSSPVGLSITNVNSGSGTARGNAFLTFGESSTLRASFVYMGVGQTANTYSGNASMSTQRVVRIANASSGNNGNDLHLAVSGGATPSNAGIIGITGGGTASGNYSFRQDTVGFRIDTFGNIHTANSNPFTVNGKSYFGGNTTATANIHIAATTSGSANGGPIKLTPTSAVLLTSPEAGVIEIDSAGTLYSTETSTQRKALVGCIYTPTSSVTVANTVTETTLLTSAITLPAAFFVAGKTLRFRLSGVHSAVSNPNIRVRVKVGGTTILDTTAMASGNSTNALAIIEGEITCRTTGASGTIIGQGSYHEYGGGASSGDMPMTNTATTTLNTTTSKTFDITVEWGTASASNTLTITNGTIEILN